MTPPATHTAAFRRLLTAGPIVTAPGVYDTLTALLAEQAGFPAAFVSGSALGYAMLGRPDVGLLSADEVAGVVARIRERLSLPLLVDADTGFGNALNVQRTVRMFERAGASGLQLEDQVNFKPPGAAASRPVIPLAEMVGKIKAALDARTDADFIVSARTDAATTLGPDEAIRRGIAFAAAGADMVFVESLANRADIERLARELAGRVPLLFNLLDGAAAPIQTVAELQALGFRMALFPGAAVQGALAGARAALEKVRAAGSNAPLRAPLTVALPDAKGVNAAIGAPAFLDTGKAYDPQAHGR
ncbi:MAG: isocitrate lyase/PEP mutase family protein [Rhodospirillaceae bacterium]|nr:isocitrate lyase/PEP mutase family protein [Rhodospirillaceae bacterium]